MLTATTRVFYNPTSFDPDLYVQPKWHEYARYVVHLLYIPRVFHRRGRQFSNLKAEYLQNILPESHYKTILQALIDGGVIECDGHYVPGLKSKGYRLTRKWYNQPHAEYVVQGRMLLHKLEKYHKEQELDREPQSELQSEPQSETSRPPVLPVHEHLLRCLHQVSIRPHETADEGQKMVVKWIQAGKWIHKPDLQGRFHTHLTNLKSSSRQHLYLKNNPNVKLVNIDIKNSQPLFFAMMLLNWLGHEGHLSPLSSNPNPAKFALSQLQPPQANLSPPTTTQGKPTQGSRHTHSLYATAFYMSELRRILESPLPKDVKRYVTLCESGQLYDQLMIEFGTTLTRDEFKKKFFGTVFFTRNYCSYPEKTKFAQLYPTVYSCIHNLKQRDHKRLPKMLQKCESDLIIHRVCRRLMDEHPEVWVATIHDSVVTTEDKAELVEGMMWQEFNSLGLSPSLKREMFNAAGGDAVGKKIVSQIAA